jgi:hypothetical protein
MRFCRKFPIFTGLLALLLPLTGCDKVAERLKDAINRAWPPISTLERRTHALAASASALHSLTPSIYLMLDESSINSVVNEIQRQISAARFQHPNGSLPLINNLKVTVDSEAVFILGDIALDLTEPAVTLKGRLSGQLAVEPRGNVLQPTASFESVEIQSVKFTKQALNADIAAPAINAILKSTLANINGAIRLQEISLAFPPIPSFDPKDIKAQGLTVTGAKVEVPTPSVSGVSLLAANNAIEVMADLRLPGEQAASVPSQSAPAILSESGFKDAFQKFKVAFAETRDGAFGRESRGGAKAAVTRRFLAKFLNTTINSRALHLEYGLQPQSQQFQADIRPYVAPQINCTLQEDTRNCRPANSCSLGHDERSCGHDIDVDLGGLHVIKGHAHVNDPVCEAAKAAQNQIYLANFNLCNGAYAAAIPVCESAKAAQNVIYAAQKAACEVDKARLQEIEKLAHIGHISGDVSVSGSAVADIHNLGVGETLESLSVDVAVAGAADVLAHVKFDPDTAGRLACVFGWDKDLKTRVSIAQLPLHLRGAIVPDDRGALVIKLDGVTIPIQLNPPPVQAIFVAHPELVVNCSLLVQGVVVPGLVFRALQQQDIPSEISGKYQVPLPSSQFAVPVQPFQFTVGSSKVTLQPKLDPKAAWFLGS